MLILDATTKSLEVVLDAVVTTSQLAFVVGYGDISQANLATTAVQASDGTTNGTTAVTMVAAPGASISRQLQHMSLQNADTMSATVTVRLNNNGTFRTCWRGTLAVGDVLLFVSGRGFFVLDSSGNLKTTNALCGVLPVANGGTGVASLTAYAVICGGTTSTGAVQSVASVGTSGQALTSNGAGALPTFQTVSAGLSPAYTAKTANYTATANDHVDCTSGTFTVTLPASSSNGNRAIWVVNSGSGTITVGRTGSDTVGNQGETSQTLNPGDSMTFLSSGTGLWRIM